jgi:ABC-type xylose transport system substrate-binding protein
VAMSVFYANKKYFIYAHINKINQKAYIGITCQTKAKYRWGKDGRHYKDQQRFYAAIKKIWLGCF